MRREGWVAVSPGGVVRRDFVLLDVVRGGLDQLLVGGGGDGGGGGGVGKVREVF